MTTLQNQLNDAIARQDALAVQLAEATDAAIFDRLDALYESAADYVELLQRQVNREQRRAAK